MFKNKLLFATVLLFLPHLTIADAHSDYLFAKFDNKPIDESITPQKNLPNQSFTLFKPEYFDSKIQHVTEREACEIAFEITKENVQTTASSVTDQTFPKKMEVFIGDENNQANLISHLFVEHLHTACGVSATINALKNPICDVKVIRNRQNIIKTLIKDEVLLKELDRSLQQLATVEKQLLSFWSKNSIVNPNVLQMLYFRAPGFTHLNKVAPALEACRSQNFVLPAFICSLPIAIPVLIIKGLIQQNNIGLTEAIKLFGSNTLELAKAIPEIIKNVPSHITPLRALYTTYGLFSFGFGSVAVYKMLKTQNKVTKHIQQLLIDTATYVTTAQNINNTITSNAIFSSTKEFEQFVSFCNTESTPSELNDLIANLNTNTFKGEPSFFSYAGRVLATYTKIQEVKDALIPLCKAIGTLDMYVAAAKMYKEHQSKNNHFCFAEFVENETPLLEAVGFWNPFIDANIVIPNDARLDNDIPNIILTGPNECGKSTILKALTYNIFLAQIFGIAPANNLRLTPFAKINCYLNITDDTSTGKSLFRAQVELSKKLIVEIQKMPKDQFIFTIMDELFTGTSALEGEEAAYIYAEKLMHFINSITIIVTHFDKLKNLEESSNGRYRNFQVEAIRNQDNTITRTFKMKSGFSTMNIAFDILAEAGVI